MIKRTLYFGNPAYLSIKDSQLLIKLPQVENNSELTVNFKNSATTQIPVEDIGIVILDNPQITITQALLSSLSENNTAIISCDSRHLPYSLMLPMAAHHAYTDKLRYQLGASLPLKKQLWQQTIVAKIYNQAVLLEKQGIDAKRLHYLAGIVKSDDVENCEGRAAAYYWKVLFQNAESFKRQRFGEAPNNLLNYGYAILRAVVARSLVASGMLTAQGIHHRNKYNPYCLADDIMEPYRPFVDERVIQMVLEHEDTDELTPALKKELLQIPVINIQIAGQKSPLMVGMQQTTASLMQCFEGSQRKLVYPEMNINE